MSKILVWIAVVMLAIYVVKSQYLTSKTYQPFIDGCMASGSASAQQCECLSKYMHKRYSDIEMQSIMDNAISDTLMQKQVARDVRLGSASCAAEF